MITWPLAVHDSGGAVPIEQRLEVEGEGVCP